MRMIQRVQASFFPADSQWVGGPDAEFQRHNSMWRGVHFSYTGSDRNAVRVSYWWVNLNPDCSVYSRWSFGAWYSSMRLLRPI